MSWKTFESQSPAYQNGWSLHEHMIAEAIAHLQDSTRPAFFE